MCCNAEFGRSALKSVGINTGEPPKLGSAETLLSWNGRRDRPQDTRRSPTRVTTSNKQKGLQKLGSAQAPSPCGTGDGDRLEIHPSPHVLSCRFWSF